MADIDRDLIFTRLPPDYGVVTPIAPPTKSRTRTSYAELDKMRVALPAWKPGQGGRPGAARAQLPLRRGRAGRLSDAGLERFVPMVVYERIQEDIPKDELIKILYWIAIHPFDGDDKAVDEMRPLGLFNGPATWSRRAGV